MITSTFIGIGSCAQKENEDLRKEKFFLQDSLFSIELEVPIELDSFYSWVDYDDTSCGHERKYRFSDSRYPIFQESGFFYLTYPDSSYRLTISHVNKYACTDRNWKADLQKIIWAYEARAKMDTVSFKVYSAEEAEINGATFQILTFKTDLLPRQKYQSTLLWAFTKIDSIDIKVEYECASKNCDSFIEKMNESIKSIKVIKI